MIKDHGNLSHYPYFSMLAATFYENLPKFYQDIIFHWQKINSTNPKTKGERQCLTTFPNTEKRVENTMCSGVFLMNFEVFGKVVKHCLECLIYLFNRN